MINRIGIISIQDDLHAYAIKNAINASGRAICHIIEVDQLSSYHHLNWDLDDLSNSFIHIDGENIAINDFSLVWWRRSRTKQLFNDVSYPPDQTDLINNDCRSAFLGLFLTAFKGKWISHPFYTERAGNKLLQLTEARNVGFITPRTLITQCPIELKKFCNSIKSKKIVKPVSGGSQGQLLYTQFFDESNLNIDHSVKVSPAIYQEYIEGVCHIRLNIFGADCYAGMIQSTELDWRPNLNVPICKWSVPCDLSNRIQLILKNLSLEMGVIDIKLTSEGEYVWLEINPQGQFLFLEPLTGTPYTEIFAKYLISQAELVLA